MGFGEHRARRRKPLLPKRLTEHLPSPPMRSIIAPLAALLTLSVAALDASAQQRASHATTSIRPTNIIYFVADGFGPASSTFAREYVHATTGRRSLVFDPYLVGTLQTWATNSRVTDSAAGGTALATGHKSYNGAIAVDTAGRALATLLEAAQDRGMATGVVVTSRITHATPACFTAHVGSRAEEDEIARQQMRLAPDVLMGGGLRHFLPADVAPGRRRDGLNLLDSLRAKGFTVATDRAAYDRATRAPFVGLLAADHLAYEIDRDPAREPSLAEMTEKALGMLNGRSRRGFVLMVEASRIDHAGHANDAAGHLHDILAYEQAFRVALDFQRRHPGTLVVATADHETGGLTLGRNLDGIGRYFWHPQTLTRQRVSYDRLFPALRAAIQTDTTGASAVAVLSEQMGISDLSDAERTGLVAALRRQPGRVPGLVTEVVARRAAIQWTTGAHTAVDVNVYASGPGADRFRGNRPNDAMGTTLARLLGLDLDALTRRLRQTHPVYTRGGAE